MNSAISRRLASSPCHSLWFVPVRHSSRQAAGGENQGQLNSKIRKGEDKVVDSVKVSDLPSPKAVFCRCWLSDKFPYCDGKHAAHNKATGDNIGPLIIENPK